MKALWPSIALCFAATLAAAQATPSKPEPKREVIPMALVVIDIQNFYFPGGKLPLVEPLPASLQRRS